MLSNSNDYSNNLLNQLAYVDINQDWKPGANLCDIVEKSGYAELAQSLRDAGFGEYVIKDYENNNSSNGFAAIAFVNPENGEVGMSFRGTENLNNFGSDIGGICTGDDEATNRQIDMLDNASTAITGDSSQASDAVSFFVRNRNDSGENYLYGHSKGGELASQVYARYHFLINGVHVINPQPINTQRMTEEQRMAFQEGKFDAIVIDGDLVWKLGQSPYPVRFVQNNGTDTSFFGPHMLNSATYDDNGNAVIEDEPFKDYFWQKVAGNVAKFTISGVQELYNFVQTFIGWNNPVYLTRDFSDESKQKLLGLVSDVENEKWCDFTDWMGDRWFDFESWIGTLDIRHYITNVNSYHKKVIDKNNTTAETINKIFETVRGVDSSYGGTLGSVTSSLAQWLRFIDTLAEIVTPGNGCFNGQYISGALNSVLEDISEANIQRVKDQLMQNICGEPVFDEELLLEYIKKNPAEMTDDEMQALLDVIGELKDNVAFYESAWSVGDDELGADFWNRAGWVSDSTKYSSFSAVSAHYNELYVSILDACLEQNKDSNTFGAALVKISNGENALNILGVDYSDDVSKIFGTGSLAAYAAKWKTEHTEHYFGKLEVSESAKFESKNGIDKFTDWAEDKLEQGDHRISEEETFYMDEDGNIIEKTDDMPTFYDRELTLGEVSAEAQARVSIYDGTYAIGENGKIGVTVGEAEAHASVSGGFYVIGADGEKKFSPGVNAEIGASVTVLEVNGEAQLVGNENLGINVEGDIVVGKAEAKAEATAQVFGEDGKLDVQFGASASAEAIAAEAKGSVGVNVLGGEVAATGGVNFGVGAHADVGYRDGVFKCDVGASLGVGVSLDLEVDVGGMVDTVCDTAEAVGDYAVEAWDTASGYISDGWDYVSDIADEWWPW